MNEKKISEYQLFLEQEEEIERLNNIINQVNIRNSKQRKANKNLEKKINKLKEREKECIEHYQVALKYANEMEERTIKAMHFIDQVLGYHLNSGYEQLDKDCNELFGILKGVDKE